MIKNQRYIYKKDLAYLYLVRTSIRAANFFEKKGSSRSTGLASEPKISLVRFFN
jgi:hypothetical protein